MAEEEPHRNAAAKETLAIPNSVRAIIDARDGQFCRVCGKYIGSERAIHHIIFGGDERGMGGRRVHEPAEMITVCWMWGGNCHDLVHRHKGKFQQILLDLAAGTHGGAVTALQVLRWQQRRALEQRRRQN